MPPDDVALLVIGGGPAGLSAAEGFRAEGGQGRVVMLSDDVDPPYLRPLLSKELMRGDDVTEQLPLRPAPWYAQHGVELRLGTAATALDLEAREVHIPEGALRFERLVLATGAVPAPLPVPGADHPDVAYLRRQGDARRIVADTPGASTAVVVGTGFIGCEVAASLAMRGVGVTLVSLEPVPQVARLGAEVGARIAGWLRGLGVRLELEAEVARIDDAHTVVLGSGGSHTGDVVVCGAGVSPEVSLAIDAGLPAEGGRLLADERMVVADGVYAAGDAVLAHNAAAGRRLVVEHWGEAQSMGEIAGRNAAGASRVWDSAPGFWSEIGAHALKYVAWGDGFDDCALRETSDGSGFVVTYQADGELVGVLTHRADDAYDLGGRLVAARTPAPAARAQLHAAMATTAMDG